MTILSGSWIVDIVLLLLTAIFLIHQYLTKKYRYFDDLGIPYYKNSIRERFSQPGVRVLKDAYKAMKDERFFGLYLYMYPAVIVKDPELTHRILVKDFAHFYDRGMPVLTDDVIISTSLFSLNGQNWRSLRHKLLPTFTTGKLKNMFSQILSCGNQFLNNINKTYSETTPVEGKDLTTDYTVEVVATTAFGINLSKENPQSAELVSRLHNLFNPPPFLKKIAFMILVLFPIAKKWLKVSSMASGAAEYFVGLTRATKQFRRENQIRRNDYFQLLLDLQEADENGKSLVDESTELSEEDKLIDQLQHLPQISLAKADHLVFNDEVMTAQVLIFMNAGVENISYIVKMALYHIAKDKEIQQRMMEEIDTVVAKHNGWTYQSVKDMDYMDQVLQETMRMYPLLPGTLRECMSPYKIPGSEVVLEPGTRVFILNGEMQMDPQFYPEPEKFDPERFLGNNHKPSPTYLPFGDGPRICIAMRFAILEMKICLGKLLSEFTVSVNSKTQEPIQFDPYFYAPPRPLGGIWLDLKKRQNVKSL